MSPSEVPNGLVYVPDFVTEAEEQALAEAFEDASFSEVVMRGQAAKRTVLHFGYLYDYEGWTLTPTESFPAPHDWLRLRAAQLAQVEPDELAETLVTRYPPGAGIGWHRDAPMFGPKVVGVSLLSACRMRFQRGAGPARQVYNLELAPRSAYVLAGAARWSWQHTISATKALRLSITFRTLAKGRKA